MASDIVKTITSPDGHRRVDIVRHSSGAYGFEEWHFSEDPDEQMWIPARKQMQTFTDTAERAENEARARVKWLKDEGLYN